MQTMRHLAFFRSIFPDHRLIALADELRYRFNSETLARIYERVAQRIILTKGLPLVTEVETWSSGGRVTEVAMVVKGAPEEYPIAVGDEAQDNEGLDGGWYATKGE